MATNRSLASLARQLQRSVPPGFPSFDANAFLNGTYQLPPQFGALRNHNPGDRSPGSPIQHHPDCPEAPWNNPEIQHPPSEHTPNPESEVRNPKSEDTSEDTSPPESETVTSGVLKTRKKCRQLNKEGKPCGAYPLKGGDLCLYHEADAVTNLREAQSRGGHANARRPIMDLETLALDLHHRLDLQAILEAVLRAQLSGAIPARRCAQVLRNLGIAERNLANIHRDPDTTDREGCANYERLTRALNAALPAILENLELELDAERARAIEDTGARREEFLKANQRFGHNQPKPAREVSPAHPGFRMPNPWANHPFLQP